MIKSGELFRYLIVFSSLIHSSIRMCPLQASNKAELIREDQKVKCFINKLSQLEKIELREDNLSRILAKATLQLDSLDLDVNINAMHKIMDRILRDKIAFAVTVQILIAKDHIAPFYDTFSTLTHTYPVPRLLQWSSSCKNADMIHKAYDNESYRVLHFSLYSNEKRLNQIKNDFSYQISDQDKAKLDLINLYSLVQRAGFDLSDFTYDSLRVRLLEVQSQTMSTCIDEIDHFIKAKRLKDDNPFHIFVIKFDDKHALKSHDVFQQFQTLKAVDYHAYNSMRGQITDPDNNCFYLCLDNKMRQQLDLHGQRDKNDHVYKGKSVAYAQEETLQFIQHAYHNFDKQVTILTGRGKHVNANGQKGVLNSAFKQQWIKHDSVASLIKSSFAIEGQGGYKVLFKKPKSIMVKHDQVKNLLLNLRPTITAMLAQDNRRLILTIDLSPQEQVDKFVNTTSNNLQFNFMANLAQTFTSEERNFYQSISPISFEEKANELKLIFKQRHLKYPRSTSWGTIFGQPIVQGTVGIFN